MSSPEPKPLQNSKNCHCDPPKAEKQSLIFFRNREIASPASGGLAITKGTVTFQCFGLTIQGYSADQAWQVIEESWARDKKSSMAVTANAEILWHARQHPTYWRILQSAELRLVDGFGLQLVGWIAGARPGRLTGVEFVESLLQIALDKNWRVALIGGAPGVAEQAAKRLSTTYPKLNLHAEQGGLIQDDGTEDAMAAGARLRLIDFAPDILLVALGHPKQETWIAQNLHDFSGLKVAVGIGGAVDYWAANKIRAPRWMRAAGLEWLWRLCREPQRWRRIVRAVVLFPGAVLLDRLFRHDYKNSRCE